MIEERIPTTDIQHAIIENPTFKIYFCNAFLYLLMTWHQEFQQHILEHLQLFYESMVQKNQHQIIQAQKIVRIQSKQ